MIGGQILLFGYPLSPAVFLLGLALVCLIIGYFLGASFSTRGVRLGLKAERSAKEESAFLKGIHSMLANETDQAITELTRAVELDSETIETYIALGHLFRSKGQFDRAVAIRQSIFARPNLPAHIKIQALFDLGVDYRQGGFLSRAIDAFKQVLEEDREHLGALNQLAEVYQELRDWDNAFEIHRRLDKLIGRPRPQILAHLKAEGGRQLLAQGEVQEAKAAFKKALGLDKGSVDALLSLGDLYLDQGEIKKALSTWRKIGQVAPELSFLALDRITGREWGAKEAAAVEEFMLSLAADSKDPTAHLMVARYLAALGREEATLAELRRILELEPNYLPAHQALGQILMDKGQIDEILTAFKELLERLPGPDRSFQCRHCGFFSKEIFWKCPSCRHWDTIHPLD